MRNTAFPRFWTDRHDAEYQRILRMKALYEGKHCIVLHDREGGWKLPIYVTHKLAGRSADAHVDGAGVAGISLCGGGGEGAAG